MARTKNCGTSIDILVMPSIREVVEAALQPADVIEFILVNPDGLSALVAVSDRVMIAKSTASGYFTKKANLATFTYQDITGVELSTLFAAVDLVIGTSAMPSDAMTPMKRRSAYEKIPNVFGFPKKYLTAWKPQIDRLQELVAIHHSQSAGQATDGQWVDQLTELTRLREAGALDRDEFETAKRRLLGGHR